jgi:DNA adenine methylase
LPLRRIIGFMTTFTYLENAAPFLKWAGGKGRLLKQYDPYFPPRNEIRHYYEPFIGGAAVFFYLQPQEATLSDINNKLVDAYRIVQQNVEGLIRLLKEHKNEKEYFYRVRSLDPTNLSPQEQAARLIFLNKTCYNGLYRENQGGRFNVPFGRYKNPRICDEQRLRTASTVLQGVNLREAEFDQALSNAVPGDFIYLDPPYAPISDTSNFTSYNRYNFLAADQHRLADTVHDLTARGCTVMLSNSSAPLVYELYGDRGYHLIKVKSRRNINSKADRRGLVTELLILNYDPGL